MSTAGVVVVAASGAWGSREASNWRDSRDGQPGAVEGGASWMLVCGREPAGGGRRLRQDREWQAGCAQVSGRLGSPGADGWQRHPGRDRWGWLGRVVRLELQTAGGRDEPWGGRRHDRRWDDRAALHVMAESGSCLREQGRLPQWQSRNSVIRLDERRRPRC